MSNYIAVDIGASSGRLMHSQLKNGRLSLVEVHRFKNGYYEKANHKYWDINQLLKELLTGLEKLKKTGITACYLGIDTWGVDYCLLDETGELLGDPMCYRDSRTDQAIEKVSKIIPIEKIYEKTGIQIQPFNTLFQLAVEKPELLKAANKILLIPDYLGYLLTGKMALERTNASTTQLVNSQTGHLDSELLAVVGLNQQQFPEIVDAGNMLGELRKADFPTFDLPEVKVINVASHDTASAVVGTPGNGANWAFISSGTWSLLGRELETALITPEAFEANYTNESGAFQRTRFLKNIMGLWIIQEIARLTDKPYSFAELAKMATAETFPVPLIDINDSRFLKPDNMILVIQEYCRENQLVIPETTAQLVLTVYHNLARCYAREIAELSTLTKPISKIQIVGGGSNANLLNQLTADFSQIEVEAGPTEATAIGNIIMQMLATGDLNSLAEARTLTRKSFELKTYYPKERKN